MTGGPGAPGAGDLARLLEGRAEVVAPALLGCRLVVEGDDGRVVLRVSEVEAYAGVGEDPGSHAHKGLRPRNATMFGRPGLLYVYFTYGMHWCANVVVHPVAGAPGTLDGPVDGGVAGAVLVRAGEVEEGACLARSRRPAAVRDADLARGPARLTRALGITGADDGTDLLDPAGRVRLLPALRPPAEVRSGPRVGVSGEGAATPWRWWDARSPSVSAYRAAQPRARPSRTARPAPGAPSAPAAGDGGDAAPGGAP